MGGVTLARQRAAFGSSQSVSDSARAATHAPSSRPAPRGVTDAVHGATDADSGCVAARMSPLEVHMAGD